MTQSFRAGYTPDGQPITYRPRRDCWDIFVGGWRVASMKTETGLGRKLAQLRQIETRSSR